MESQYGSHSSQNLIGELQPIVSIDGVEFVIERGSSSDSTDSPNASSSSSDSSSDEEFIQVDHTSTPLAMSTKNEEEEYLRSSSFDSRISDVTIESFIPDVSPTQSPPIMQSMERRTKEEDFDPNRIPTSIFEKPSSPMDWSVASNESLFSIHIGNYSFNKDQIAVLGGESGEFIRSDNFYESKNPKLPSENVKCKENGSQVKDIQKPQNFVACKPIVLEQALGNIPKKSIKHDNHKAGMRKKSRCCYSMSACSCKWLTCPSCSYCSSYSCCSSNCSCKKLCWPNCCRRSDICCCHPTTWPCFNCNCKCSTWWNLCNCFSTCSSCCSRGFCSTSSWRCSAKNIFCCFSFQRSRNLQSKRCRCCFSCCS